MTVRTNSYFFSITIEILYTYNIEISTPGGGGFEFWNVPEGGREGAVSPYRLAPARRDCELSRTRPPCPPSRTSRPTPPPSPSRLFPALPARPGGERDEYDREVPKKICPHVPPSPPGTRGGGDVGVAASRGSGRGRPQIWKRGEDPSPSPAVAARGAPVSAKLQKKNFFNSGYPGVLFSRQPVRQAKTKGRRSAGRPGTAYKLGRPPPPASSLAPDPGRCGSASRPGTARTATA